MEHPIFPAAIGGTQLHPLKRPGKEQDAARQQGSHCLLYTSPPIPEEGGSSGSPEEDPAADGATGDVATMDGAAYY